MKAIITGSNGLLGSALRRKLGEYAGHYYHTRKDSDLSNRVETRAFFNKLFSGGGYDALIHCAAKIGGVLANSNDVDGFFVRNVEIDENVLENAYRLGIPNVVTVLSTCVFPDNGPYPMTVNRLYGGEPHPTHRGYAYAKRLLAYKTEVYGKMAGANWFSVIPTNMFGINDDFNLSQGHIVGSLIHKAYEASAKGGNFVVWGDGSPMRQFVFADDMAEIIVWAIENWKSGVPMIAVNEKEYSVRELATIIAAKFGISEERIKYDASKPNGQLRKPAKSDMPDFKFTPIEAGLEKTINWFKENINHIRE